MSGSSLENGGNVEGSGTAGHAHNNLVHRIARGVALIGVCAAVFGACFGIPPPAALAVLVSGLVATVTFVVVDRPACAWASAIAALLLCAWFVPGWSCFLIAALPIWALGYVFSPDRNSRRERVIFACVVSVAIVAVAFNLVGAMAHGDSTYACENNLRALYAAIQQSVARDRRLPIDDQRRLLLANSVLQGAAESELRACCGGDIASCYHVGRDVAAGDVGDDNKAPPKILLYDRPGNHIRVLANGMPARVNWVVQEDALLLLSDGSVFHWRGDSPAYRAWAEGYAQGIGEGFPPRMEERVRAGYTNSG